MNLQTLKIETLIIHRVPQKPEDPKQKRKPRLSGIADPQTQAVRDYFTRRLRKVILDRGQPVERDPDLDAEATDGVRATLEDADELVARSQDLAKRLYVSQDRRSPEGILVVALCKLDGRPGVGLLKLEHEQGVQAEEELKDGELHFRIVLHQDLMLTEKTKVFKTGFFRLTSAKKPDLEAIVSDLQVEANVASFFLHDFLGCRLVLKPSVRTESYFNAVEGFIKTVTKPERRARYEIALLNQMHSSGVKTVDPVQFANDSLLSQDRADFRSYLSEQEVPLTRFSKDISAIEGRIKRVAYDFESGIKLMGEPKAMKKHVAVDGKDPTKASTVTVRDRISDVHARG